MQKQVIDQTVKPKATQKPRNGWGRATVEFQAGWQAAQNRLAETYLPYSLAETRLEVAVCKIDTLAQFVMVDQVRDQVIGQLSQLADDLDAAYEHFVQCAQRIDADFVQAHLHEVAGGVTARIEGVQRLASGQDDGESLRAAIEAVTSGR